MAKGKKKRRKLVFVDRQAPFYERLGYALDDDGATLRQMEPGLKDPVPSRGWRSNDPKLKGRDDHDQIDFENFQVQEFRPLYVSEAELDPAVEAFFASEAARWQQYIEDYCESVRREQELTDSMTQEEIEKALNYSTVDTTYVDKLSATRAAGADVFSFRYSQYVPVKPEALIKDPAAERTEKPCGIQVDQGTPLEANQSFEEHSQDRLRAAINSDSMAALAEDLVVEQVDERYPTQINPAAPLDANEAAIKKLS
ncbi:hypothetical protein MMC28_008598 [Mycoblastus sanguinarius]|nr:hypothetical protein [Mycoblastus sanguinarius]